MYNVRYYDEELISSLINSINNVQFKKIRVELLSDANTKIRICSKFDENISNFQTHNIASYDVRFYFIFCSFNVILL